MNWLNVHTGILQRPEFTAAQPAEVGTWLKLACYCASQENGGLIADCRAWTDRQWLIAAGVTAADIAADSKLWRWSANNGLLIANYPQEKEREVQLKRRAGKATANRRWGKKLRVNEGKNGQTKNSSAINSAISSASSSADAEVEEEE